MMSSEIFLDAVSYLDYATLVVLRLTSKQLLSFVDRYAEQLAFRRTFSLAYWGGCQTHSRQLSTLSVSEIKADGSLAVVHTVELDGSDEERIADAAAELQFHVGPHGVHTVDLLEFSFSVKPLVDLIPAARQASEVRLLYAEGSSPSSEEFVEVTSFFEAPTWIQLSEIPIKALALVLTNSRASRLTGWSASAPLAEENIELDATLERTIYRSCFDFTNHEQGEPREVWFADWSLRWDFLRRLIETSEASQYGITVVVSKPTWVTTERLELGDGFALSYWRLPLDPESFEERCVKVQAFLQRGQHQPKPWAKIAYFSKRSDVVVFVREDIITITNISSTIENASR